MGKQDISVDELVGMYRREELQLPQIQRQYVWRAPKVRDLLDSLYRQYPTGSILVWETDQPVPTRESAIEQGHTAFAGQKLLLDGQQRITSLAAVMSGKPVKVRGRKNPIDILFNLDHPDGPPTEVTEVEEDDAPVAVDDGPGGDDGDDEEDEEDLQERLSRRTFVVSSRALAKQPNWVSVTRVFGDATDAELLKRAGVTGFDDSRYPKYMDRLNRLRAIRTYPYVMHVLGRDLAYEEIAEIFVRVNSLGVKLRSSDLALAQITARWRTFMDLVEEFQEECEKRWFTLDTGLLVRTMVVFASKQSKFQRAGSIPLPDLEAGWAEAVKGLAFAINFLQHNADIDDETLLSAPTLMIPLAVFSRLKGEKLSKAEEQGLLFWLHVANLRGRYSRGSTETLLNEDIAILFRGGSPEDLLQPIVRTFGRLDVQPSDLQGRAARSPLFPLSYLTLKARGAKDWETGVALALGQVGRQHLIQYHHIFPKAVLRDAGYEQGEINEIANLAFIAGRTNQKIGRKPPEVYFPKVIERRSAEALETQLIPLDQELWKVENYRAFLAWRRDRLAEAINQHLEHARSG